MVTGIGGLIHVYAIGYMHEDDAFWRFFAYLNLFTFAMLTLVMGDNLLLLFLGWEGVGFCSWGLIGFWHKELANTTAGNKAFIVNRIGDFGFVLGIFLLFWSLDGAGHATLTFRELREHVHLLDGMSFWGVHVPTLVTLLLFVGATGKSAQIPLYVWLPDAMAGPTPVSALIHAATMVNAGVYLVARANPLFASAQDTMVVVAAIGIFTAILAASIAFTQTDIKGPRVPTCRSWLHVPAMGVGAHGAGIFHLTTHVAKACRSSAPAASSTPWAASRTCGRWVACVEAALHVEDVLIATGAHRCPFSPASSRRTDPLVAFERARAPLLWAVATLVAGLTAFYMFRQVFMVFFGECRADHDAAPHPRVAVGHDRPAVLAGGSILVVYLGVPHVLSAPLHLPHYFNDWLAPVFGGHGPIEEHAPGGGNEGLELLLMAISVAVAATGAGLAYLMYYRRTIRPETFSELAGGAPYRVVLNKYYVDELYDLVFVRGTLLLSRAAAWFDLHVIDGLVNLSAQAVVLISQLAGFLDNLIVDGAVNAVGRPPGRWAAACAASRREPSARISTSSCWACWAASSCGGPRASAS